MNRKEQIRQGLKKLAANEGPLQTLLATVVSVDEEVMTCVVADDDIEIADVRLRNVINGNESITIYPKINTWVLCLRIEANEDWMIIACDEIDKYRIVIGDLLFEMKDGKYLLQSGNENLGKCIDDLIIQIQSIYAPKNTVAITAIQERFKLLLSGT